MSILLTVIDESFSKHFKIALCALLAVGVTIILTYRTLKARIEAGVSHTPASHVLLPKNDKEQIHINSSRHTITIVTPGKSTTEFAKNPTIEVRNNGQIVVARHITGFEVSPTLGASYGDKLRVALGSDLFYLYRFDVGVSGLIANGGTNVFRLGVTCSYNLYDSTSIFVGLDSAKSPIGGIKLRF
jgi:hypothetical protein